MFDLLVVLLALGLLIYLAFRGITLILLSPAAALLAAGLTGGLPILAAYTQIFMTNTGQFIIAFFPLFLLGTIFGKLMDDTVRTIHCAGRQSMARVSSRDRVRRAVLRRFDIRRRIRIRCCLCDLSVAAALFREADIPKRLIPGADCSREPFRSP